MAVGGKNRKTTTTTAVSTFSCKTEGKKRKGGKIKIAISNIWQGAQKFQRKESWHACKMTQGFTGSYKNKQNKLVSINQGFPPCLPPSMLSLQTQRSSVLAF